jgi:hypothetical protein
LLRNARELEPALSGETFRDGPRHAARGLRIGEKSSGNENRQQELQKRKSGARSGT